MGYWDGTKIGLKVNESEEELAQEFLMSLGLKLTDNMTEEIGELSDLKGYSVVGIIRNSFLGIMPALDKMFGDYQKRMYIAARTPKYKFERTPCVQLDDFYTVVKRMFPDSCMYMVNESGSNTNDYYYRCEVIYSGDLRTELDCFYSYGDGINVSTDNPKAEGTVKFEDQLKAREPDAALKKQLLMWAGSGTSDELCQKLKGAFAKSSASEAKAKKPVPAIPGLKVVRGVVIEYTGKAPKLELPEGIKKIEEEAFLYNTALREIKLPETLEHIGERAFKLCIALTEIEIPKKVKFIGAEAFAECEKIRKISVPEGIERIEKKTFAKCSALHQVILPSTLTVIEEDAFNWCKSLNSVSIPDGVRRIGNNAFLNCEHLTKISLPDSLTDLGSGAFSGCSSLTRLDIPAGVKYLGAGLATDDTEIHISGLEFWFSIIMRGGPLNGRVKLFVNDELVEDLVIPSTVTEIDRSVFSGYRYLRSVIIPDSVTSIGDYAFAQCPVLKKAVVPKALEEAVKLYRVFDDCKELTDAQYI